VLEQTIIDVHALEQSIEGRALADLRVRLALRSCLSELRGLVNGNQNCYVGDAPSAPKSAIVPIKIATSSLL
jgi:hypothetical protein